MHMIVLRRISHAIKTQSGSSSSSSHEFCNITLSDCYTMRILNVAEKNDAAKNIANLLSGGNVFKREGRSKYNKIYEFDYDFRGQKSRMVMTSVSGHLLNHAFIGNYKKWTSCSPEALFEAPLVKQCPAESTPLKETLEREVKNCDALIIWTDCDREGEGIGFEIISVCENIKPNISIHRAKFSEITRHAVKFAMDNLGPPNKSVSDAVDVRSELDLRIGASFTRFQTLRLQKVFPSKLRDSLVSYGSCQFPTLGFVVERYKSVLNFIPEKFWKIEVAHNVKKLTTEFAWKRLRLFNETFCQVLYDKCKENPIATVENVETKPKSKWRPVPLDTVELEKTASRKLRINAKQTMQIAESLYNKGFISYPRTETNIFPGNMNLRGLVGMQTGDNKWGDFATKLLEQGINPRAGKKSDQAHPPIHPTKYTNSLTGNDAKIYEYIVRHFLACLSKNAEGSETIVTIDINGEKFVASGLLILEMNYLEVYPYEKWNTKEIHEYVPGEKFTPTTLEMVEGQTSPPNLLTEADLISLMEKNGIGTDATHAEHIDTIKQRMYVGLQDNLYFVPGELGMGLVEGYDDMGFEMSKPYLRAELEADLKKICLGEKDPKEVLTIQIQKYKEVFKKAVERANKLDQALNKYFQTDINPVDTNLSAFIEPQSETIFKCSKCGGGMILRRRRDNTAYFISCNGYPDCRNAIWFPSKVVEVNMTADTCGQCGLDVHLLTFKFRPGSMAPFYPNVYTGCIAGCDEEFLKMLEVNQQSHDRGSNLTRQNQNRNNVSQNQSNIHDDDAESSNQTRTFVIRDTGDDNDIQCNCGIPARRFTVQKEGPNKGRPFYVCSKSQQDRHRCNFFMWADGETAQPRQNVRNRNNFGGSNYPRRGNFKAKKKTVNGRTTAGTRKCGNCRQEGHTRNNCPLLNE